MSTISPNMGLVISTIGADTGLLWEENLNASLTTIDGHNHTPGNGVQITPLGLNINSNLNFQNNSAQNIYGLMFSASGTNTSTGLLYTAPSSGGGVNDLFYNDFAGNVIQITKAGALNAAAASIPGESYAAGTFTWKQGAGSLNPANFDIGSITLRPNVPSTTNGTTINGATSAAVTLTLPNSSVSLLPGGLPASPVFATVDASGNIGTYTAGSAGQIPVSQGTAGLPIWTTPVANKAPTIQTFTQTSYYTFTIIALTNTISAGATYTNNGQTFTVKYAAAIGATTLYCGATGAPTASGTLTLASGSGQSSVLFSSNSSGINYILPTSQTPLYIKVTAIGAGGGGSSGNGGGNGGSGGNTTFGSASLIVATGGAGGSSNGGTGAGPGGAGGIPTSTLSSIYLAIGGQGSSAQNVGASSGSNGGSSINGGAGGGGTENTNGFNGAANTGGGGGGCGSSSTNLPGAGGGSGGAVVAFITSLSSTYSIAVGAGGSAGTGGGTNGGSGGSGIIVVEEFYQ